MKRSWTRRRVLFVTGGGSGIAAAVLVLVVVLAGLPVRPSLPYVPPPPAITVINNSGNVSITLRSYNGSGNYVWSWDNVTSIVTLNSSGVSSSFSLHVSPGAQEIGNMRDILITTYLSGVLSAPLAPTSTWVLVDPVTNNSSDPLFVFGFQPAGTPVNVSQHPWFVNTYNVGYNGTVGDYSILVNDSRERTGSFQFYVPVALDMLGEPIPTHSIAYNTFDVVATLNGLGALVMCSVTVNVTFIYN